MSADNFYLIRRAGARYGVSMEFASSALDPDTEPGSIREALSKATATKAIDDPRISWFDSLEDARTCAASEWSEYGVEEDIDNDASEDTEKNRLKAVCAAWGETLELHGSSGGGNTVEVWFDGVKITVESTTVDPYDVVDWLMLTSPESLNKALG